MKIETNSDIYKRKNRHKRIGIGSDPEDDSDVNTRSYLDDVLEKKRAANTLKKTGVDDDELRKMFADAGILSFDKKTGIAISDNRISPAQEKQMLEFAQHVSGNNPNYIVELADKHYRIYGKELKSDGTRDFVVEFAEYPRPTKKTKLETNEA